MRVSNPGKGARRNAGRSPARSSRLQGARRLKKIEHRNFFENCEGHECLNSLSRCVLYQPISKGFLFLSCLRTLSYSYQSSCSFYPLLIGLRWFGQTDQMAGLGFGPRWDGDRRLDPLKIAMMLHMRCTVGAGCARAYPTVRICELSERTTADMKQCLGKGALS